MTPPQPHIILASSSPRRRELLQEAGYDFTVVAPTEDVECGVCSDFGPSGLVADLAYRKASAVREMLEASPEQVAHSPESNIIVAADTVDECDGFTLGKPRDEDDARVMLQRLSNRDHRVLSGVCVWRMRDDVRLIRVAVSKLRMDRLTDAQLDEYLASGQWEGKAGSFGYQDRLGWVHLTEGTESNVVGLPMELLREMLEEITAPSEV